MNLEKRVQLLEQELQILKNQIQATLLNIQEQLLTNAYPSLRANDVPSSNNEVHPPHSTVSMSRQEASFDDDDAPPSRNVRQVSLNNPKDPSTSGAMSAPVYDDERSDTSAAVPVVRKVSIDDLDPMPSHRQQAYATSMPQQQSRRPTDSHQNNGRDQQAGSFYEQDNFTSDEFVYDGKESAPFVVETDWETLANLEEWSANKIEALGVARTQKLIRAYGQQGRFTNQIMSALLQFVALYDEEHSSALPTPDNPDELPSYFSDTDDDYYDYEDDEDVEDHPEENRRTVLRLIAGIQNAGAGIRGKRRNG